MLGGSAVLAYVSVPLVGWAPAPEGHARASAAAPLKNSRRSRRPSRRSLIVRPSCFAPWGHDHTSGAPLSEPAPSHSIATPDVQVAEKGDTRDGLLRPRGAWRR